MAGADMRGLFTAIPAGQKTDMAGIQNPLSGFPASLALSFRSPGWPLFAADTTLLQSDPTSIPNLVGWWKASDFDNVVDGTEIVQWYDHSPMNRPVTAVGSAGSRMIVQRNAINGNMTAVKGNAQRGFKTNMNVVGSALTSKTVWSIFLVVSFTSLNTTTESNIFGFNCGGSNDVRMGINSTGPGDINLVYANVGGWRTTTALTVNDWHYMIYENDADTETVYLDGAALTWNTTPGTPAGTAPQELYVLDSIGTASVLRGACAEVGLYDRALISGERSTLYAYWRSRYGLV